MRTIIIASHSQLVYRHPMMIPNEVSHPLAAKLLNLTEAQLSKLITEGLLSPTPRSRRHRRYLVNDLACLLDRPITETDYLRADREHDRRRAAVKRYNDRVRGFSPLKISTPHCRDAFE
jgi:hypothetical protein